MTFESISVFFHIIFYFFYQKAFWVITLAVALTLFPTASRTTLLKLESITHTKPSEGHSESGREWPRWPLMKSLTRRSNMVDGKSRTSWSSSPRVSTGTAPPSMAKEASWLMPTSLDLGWEGTRTLTQMSRGPLETRTYKVDDFSAWTNKISAFDSEF